MIPAARLDQLGSPLPAGCLYLFVCGPGGTTGHGAEALALALPGQGWLTIDACKVGTALPQERIISRWCSPGEPLLAAVLTHPHDDHAAGLGELLDVLRPPVVAVTGNPPPEQDLARRVGDLLSSGVTNKDIASRTVISALNAMQRLVTTGATRLVPLRDGEVLIPGPATVRCLAPTSSEISALLGTLPKEQANELSAVLEVTWGATRLLLGADLPWKNPRGTVLQSGWASVDTRHPGLARHTGLKVPHHGSREALHPGLLGAPGTVERLWVCTPFERSDLPRMDPGDGADQLLAAEPRLHLTKRPHVKDKAPGATLSISSLRTPPGAPRSYRVAPPVDPLDAVWCFAFDDKGQLAGRWRGDAAVEVVPEPSGV
ncbi:MBL fold metallo-hydrolase [Myxococcus sp. RHSTA-1-4]|uniref:MBL fold metallo-hydrolase n=1 Tax=Myxococcus sp. RHSTA-1-4 TaxID=2874601 RepID=UPI001CBF3892|nr:MBL fold metallo-hydrolase [Myxococcus sp. RHSTA-1-4]MBZ4417639.1 MBL fold metallo-hydrolase [Myxococcus sp. RHSTA-1-4]